MVWEPNSGNLQENIVYLNSETILVIRIQTITISSEAATV